MISDITLKNFKSHINTHLKLENLNIFTGANGTGKSSLSQSLLLLRQSFKHNGLIEGIQLNKPLINLGIGKDALYQYAKEDYIEFSISIDINQTLIWQLDITDIDTTFLNFIKQPNIKKEELKKFALFSNSFQYLSAERLAPQESYEKDDYSVKKKKQISKDLGKGELIAHYLSHYGYDKVNFPALFHPNNQEEELLSQTNSWLQEISPNVNVEVLEMDKLLEMTYTFNVSNDFPTDNFSPKNVGFGITYALPIIVAILSAEKGSLIIIENPEAHIHPSGQAKLAELMAIAAQCGIQLIIETHSDHIINGILVATKKFEETGRGIDHKNIKMYLFERSESGHSTEVKNIEVHSRGRIQSPPKGFFDQIALDRKYLRGF